VADINNRQLFTKKDLFYLLYLFPFRQLCTFLPVKCIRFLASPLAYIYRFLSAAIMLPLQERLKLVFEGTKTRKEIIEISDRFIRNAAVRGLDDIILNRLRKNDLLQNTKIVGLENLKNALAEKKGVMLISGHFFCNRVAKCFLGEIGFPVLSIRNKFPQDVLVGKIGARYLKNRYVNFLKPLIKDEVFIQDKDSNLKILQRIRKNGLVNIHIDAPFSYRTAEYSFLKKRRRFPVGFLRIADLTKCVIVPMTCIGNSGSFTIIFDEVFGMDKGSTEEDTTLANLGRLVRGLEDKILEYPDQWELWVNL
jgi:lauroyl/myristoyl acyltransferase